MWGRYLAGGDDVLHMTGVRAELVFETPDTCPVASASTDLHGALTDVSWTASRDDTVTEQFASPDTIGGDEDIEQVFDYGSRAIYQFDRAGDTTCLCEAIEESVGPITETYAVDGDLHVTLHADDVSGLRTQLQELNEQSSGVRIEYLVRGRDDADDSALVPVDLQRLTDRQREVLATAHEMGYFEYPRGANASEVAAALDIQRSTFTEHLNTAQSKLLDELQFDTPHGAST
jgi:predicted DNA binding protein